MGRVWGASQTWLSLQSGVQTKTAEEDWEFIENIGIILTKSGLLATIDKQNLTTI